MRTKEEIERELDKVQQLVASVLAQLLPPHLEYVVILVNTQQPEDTCHQLFTNGVDVERVKVFLARSLKMVGDDQPDVILEAVQKVTD